MLQFGPANGQVFEVTSPAVETGANFGFGVVVGPDINDDGAREFAVGAVTEDVDGVGDSGAVHVFDGRNREHLMRLAPPSPGIFDRRGEAIAAIDDITGDGVDDWAVGAFLFDAAGIQDSGAVDLFDAANGAHIATLTSPNPVRNGWFGQHVSAGGDMTGDGVGEILVGGAYIFDGETRELVHTVTGVGDIIAGIPDSTGDGLADFAIASSSRDSSEVNVFSGADASLVITVQPPNPEFFGGLGTALIGLPDVNNDGRGDFAVSAPFATVNAVDSAG